MEEMSEEKRLNLSMQCVALDTLLSMKNLDYITDIKELGFEEQYSYVSAKVNNRDAGILIIAQMYPADYNAYIYDNMEAIKEVAKDIFEDKNIDIYVVGAGLINNHVPEEEKGIFRIGAKYAASFGIFNLISIAEKDSYGLIEKNPIKLSMVSDEYFYANHLISKFGDVEGYDRTGSVHCDEYSSNPLDRWEIFVEVYDKLPFPFVFKYILYMDAYALDNLKTNVNDIKKTPIFFEWKDED